MKLIRCLYLVPIFMVFSGSSWSQPPCSVWLGRDLNANQRLSVEETSRLIKYLRNHSKANPHDPLPEIFEFMLEGVEPLEMDKAVYQATLDDQKVFIKVDQKGFEGYWLEYLNSMGLGAKFLGVTKIDGKDAYVTEFVSGYSITNPYRAPKNFILTKNMIAEMNRQLNQLFALQITPHDIQFMASEDGKVILIDPEYFDFNPANAEDKAKIENVLRERIQTWNDWHGEKAP